MVDESTPQGDNLLAAELVLGLLAGDEQRDALTKSRTEPTFAALVAGWQERFVPMTDAIEPVAPPRRAKKRLLKRLFNTMPVPLSQRLWVWKGLSVAALAVATYLGVQQLAVNPVSGTDALYATQLSSTDVPLQVLAVFDSARGDVALSRVAGKEGESRAFELWAIVPEAAPVSLGVLSEEATMRVSLPQALRDRAGELTLAISDEPAGGSPTGAPTGSILAAAPLTEL
ncbi:anti-sigma factor [Sulfitobacter sp.]|uniref:anti-sigma factor n=1 Tax=Sulfitobacter sp. TaxID=1903071 RepID=UPI0030023825